MSAPLGEPLGGVTEEARRLVEAVSEWASARLDATEKSIATDSAACRVCPVCQLIAAVRGDGVDVVARFGEAWSAFLGVLAGHEHSAASASGRSSSDTEPDIHPAAPETTGARPVQPIPVD